ncbi:hypothetical protein F2Q70_00015352 [Brassica cretica]|uniref:Uncharacterized protein n=1 Tax=Brassica cretica TaxID=69181 RepID=A0A8S9I1Y1_BRACR|nr:hypothetical protein F2Q70_00015352 [Brassica cretica]
MFASRLQIARGFMTSLRQVVPHLEQVAPLLESCRREVELRAGASPRCKRSCCLRFVWSGCRRSLP